MKIGVVGDVHWCSSSSIVRSMGVKYSTRLENLIESVNWAEKQLYGCDIVVYLGDFFDRSDLNSQEITALKELKWNSSVHIFLLGNHEIYSNSYLTFNSLYSLTLQNNGNFILVDKPRVLYDMCFLPYGNYDKSIEELFPKDGKRILFSHNDLKGIQYGGYLTTSGVDMSDIEKSCELFVNGHLHNHYEFGKNIINLGNLTGQNFSEDASKYKHSIMVLDSDTMQIEYFRNPYALNFYKLDLTESVEPLETIEGNAVLSIVTRDTMLENVKKSLEELDDVVETRIVTFASAKPISDSRGVGSKEVGSKEHFYGFLSGNGVKIPKEFVYEVLA